MAKRNGRVENGMEISYDATSQELGNYGYYSDCWVKSYDGQAKEVIVPDDVTVISVTAFQNSSKLESIKIGKGVYHILCDTFNGCNNLKSVSISSNIKKLYLSAFYGCDSLKNFHIDGDFRKIDIICDGISYRSLKTILGNLNEQSLLCLIEYCPEVCFAIPSERCTDEFMSIAEYAIVNGMCKRAELDPSDKETIDKDVALLSKLKEWKREEYDKHLTPIGRLMTAIGDFKDNSK